MWGTLHLRLRGIMKGRYVSILSTRHVTPAVSLEWGECLSL